jgi:hypothetical protein
VLYQTIAIAAVTALLVADRGFRVVLNVEQPV